MSKKLISTLMVVIMLVSLVACAGDSTTGTNSEVDSQAEITASPEPESTAEPSAESDIETESNTEVESDVESEPVESEPVESEPVESEPSVESKPPVAESEPVESEPVESKPPIESKPPVAESEPVESAPESKPPVESNPPAVESEPVESEPVETETKITVTSYSEVEDGGYARIWFEKGDKEYTGMINSKGKIVFYKDAYSVEKMQSVGNGVIYALVNDSHIVLDCNTGKQTTFSKEDFSKIIGYGDGRILGYKNHSSISASEHIYILIDGKTGKVLYKNTCEKQIQHPYEYKSEKQNDYLHMGDGWFISTGSDSGVTTDTWIYDSGNNVSYVLDSSISVVGDSFVNGKIYMTTNSRRASITRRVSDGTGYRVQFPGDIDWHFTFSQKGVVEKAEAFSAGSSSMLATYEDVDYLTITDIATGKTVQYTDFPADMIEYVKVYDNYCLVFLEGKDYNDYFTVVNKQGKQLFEPLVNKSDWSWTPKAVYLAEDRIMYHVRSKSSNSYYTCKVLDMSGKELFFFDYVKSDETIEFKGGIVKRGEKYINKSGKTISIIF